jgi:hypothetical protein
MCCMRWNSNFQRNKYDELALSVLGEKDYPIEIILQEKVLLIEISILVLLMRLTSAKLIIMGEEERPFYVFAR